MKRNSINDCDCFQVRNFCHKQPLLLLAPGIEHPNFATAENCRLPLVSAHLSTSHSVPPTSVVEWRQETTNDSCQIKQKPCIRQILDYNVN